MGKNSVSSVYYFHSAKPYLKAAWIYAGVYIQPGSRNKIQNVFSYRLGATYPWPSYIKAIDGSGLFFKWGR